MKRDESREKFDYIAWPRELFGLPEFQRQQCILKADWKKSCACNVHGASHILLSGLGCNFHQHCHTHGFSLQELANDLFTKLPKNSFELQNQTIFRLIHG